MEYHAIDVLARKEGERRPAAGEGSGCASMLRPNMPNLGEFACCRITVAAVRVTIEGSDQGATMTVIELKQTRAALLDGVARLVDEYDAYPAGVVMRCYSRAVHVARRAGCPPSELPAEVERRTRATLAARFATTIPAIGTTPYGDSARGRVRTATGADR